MFASPYPNVSIPELSLYDFLFGSIDEADLDRAAVTDGTSGATTTYRELIAQIDAIAGALAADGVAVGDVVALHSPNTPAFVAVFHGILRAGATATTINALATADDIASQLSDAGATRLITVTPLLDAALTGSTRVGLVGENVIVLDGAEGHRSLSDLIGAGLPAPDVIFDPSVHLAVLPFSSGTTAKPKGVMLTHRNLVANVAQGGPLIGVTSDDTVLAVLPFFHIYGMTVLLNLALSTRATLVTMPRFDLVEFLRIITDHRCSYIFIAPPIAVALAKHPLVDQYQLDSVRVVMSGAASLDEAIAAAVAERLTCRVIQGYGMSEMSPVSHAHDVTKTDIPLGSVGFTIPNVECRLIDPLTGDEIAVPETGVSRPGELLCRGPNIMVGYLGNEQASRDALTDDGFLHTGDVATVSAEGYVTIVDRLKELIKYKGHQVAPAELEALLLSHPLVADAAVIGVADADGEEVPKAYVVLQPQAELTEDEVIAFVAERVAPYKKVRQVEMIETIPKSSSGKILRKDLRILAGRS
ncbi:AMP-binding protein [Marisediminicola antarctica]|uniref:AMP-dependent synthetase n=1 Tax=Marisediminicola antarctica TaxID=674079 RepID=A0A7L5AI63_9MICO|nr:AMP-binding protein [Marisediminicola antarctica]QHO69465.1 AMP-dependent synthetase [Marisediminicola antarctica]